MDDRPKLLVIIDSEKYIVANCFQHQLFEVLSKVFRVDTLTLRQIKWNPFVNIGDHDVILSVLRQRTLASNVGKLSKLLNGRPVIIYDQDPWQSFIDDSPTRGCYELFAKNLNIRGLMLTSNWWVQFCRERDFPAHFVRMGMLPEYCKPGLEWTQRTIDLGFQGTLHPHRKAFFEELLELGIEVNLSKSCGYTEYLDALSSMRVFVHTEDAPWIVEGRSVARNALWIKDVEAAARGCFALRNWDEDYNAYGLEELPTIIAFRHISEIPDIIERIRNLPEKRRQAMINTAVNKIRDRNDWMTVVQCLNRLQY